MIDLLLLAVLAVVTWCVASDGAWSAGLTFLSVLFAGLLAMNFFEPLANWMEGTFSSTPEWQMRWDYIALVGLFTALVFGLRFATEYIVPTYIQVPRPVHEAGRWICALGTGYVTMAFLLAALHTAPLPREFVGFKPERRNFFSAAAPDRQWLGFTQYVSEKSLGRGDYPRIFDGPQFTLPNQTNNVWPSFPIRYASRREAFASGNMTQASQSAPPQVIPRGGAGGGSGSPAF